MTKRCKDILWLYHEMKVMIVTSNICKDILQC